MKETIESITTLIITLIEKLHLPPTFVGAVLIVVTTALLYWHWIKNRHLFDGQRLRVTRTQGYVADGSITDESLRKILTEERDEQVFAHVFGYRLEAAKRNLLHSIVQAEAPLVSWWSIKSANPYIQVLAGKLFVKLSRLDIVMHTIHRAYCHAMFLFAFLVAMLLAGQFFVSGKDVLPFFIILMVLCLVLFITVSFDSGVGTARRLERWLKEQEKSKSSASTDAITK